MNKKIQLNHKQYSIVIMNCFVACSTKTARSLLAFIPPTYFILRDDSIQIKSITKKIVSSREITFSEIQSLLSNSENKVHVSR